MRSQLVDIGIESVWFWFAAILMSICSLILAGLEGKYAFYAAIPVALTFGMYFVGILQRRYINR